MDLDSIKHPSDLSSLNTSELNEVAKQIREQIINTVSENGGHLASNLGVVELTIALLSIYEPPKDKIVWDVGHQCYPYKILTDRRKTFGTLRRGDGISGFPCKTESEFDCFGTGHATTSISAALGCARARDMKDEDHKVVAVIGDGALTGGIAWEAVNNAGTEGTDILVVLNDNGMSISPNIGALAGYMSHLRTQPFCHRVEYSARHTFSKLTRAGRLLAKFGDTLSRGLTTLVSPKSGTIFESLGFTYIGPVDGHNIRLLKQILLRVKNLKGPILLHVVTTKGKGYKYAEKNARIYHGVGTFNVSSGKLESNGTLNYSQIFGDSLMELAEARNDVCAITAAMPDGTGLTKFAERFPDRFFNVGIAEEHAVIFAAGLASGGMKPVVAIYSTFLQRAYDQIVHDVCLQNLPVIFAIDRAGIVGQDGATHQGTLDISYLRHIPNLVLLAPRSGAELRAMMRWAISSGKPCAIRYPRDGEPGLVDAPLEPIREGKAEVIKNGSDVTIIGIGGVLDRCLAASKLLEQEGASVSVVNARFAKPLDKEMIVERATNSGAIVTIEEHVRDGGFGSSVLEVINEYNLPINKVLTIALPDEFITHGSSTALRKKYGCDTESIAARIKAFLS